MEEDDGKDGGYDCDLVEEPLDDLVCPICLLPLKKPHLISCCGRKLCQTCISRIKEAGQPCPCCRGNEYVIVIDRQVERRVLDLKVYCKYKSKGCTWSGELRDLEKHVKSCYTSNSKLIAEKNEIIEKQAQKIKELENNITAVQKKNESLEKRLIQECERQKNLQKLSSFEDAFQDKVGEIEQLQKSKDALKHELDDVTSYLQQIQVFSDRKEDELIAAQNMIKQLKEENQTVLAEKTESETHLRIHCSQLEESRRKLEGEKESLLGYSEYYQAEAERNQQSIEVMKVQISSLENDMNELAKELDKEKTENQAIVAKLASKELDKEKTKNDKFEHELKQFQLMHDRKIAEKNEILEHQAEEMKTLEEEARKLQDQLARMTQQETAMKKSIQTLDVENEQLKCELRELKQQQAAQLPKYTPSDVPPPPYGQGNSRLVHPPPPQHTEYALPTQHLQLKQLYDKGDINKRTCPMCGLAFPARTSQANFVQHVKSHFRS